MGIQGLLPTLKSIMNPGHIRDFAGKRAAIDTYSWLHKAAFTCSKDICEGRPNTKYIDYCLHRINLLRHHGVQPVLVFDGGVLPMKSDQEIKRARSRKENLERAVEHERMGNHSAAYECYQKAVDITPAIAYRLIKVLQQENVEYVVAPYEADAQMAFLALHGHVDLIITEDSDLIAYGCPRVFFKMDKFGHGVEFQYSDIMRNKDVDFNNFSKQMILEMCIMSGCDYLPSLPGMGVKRAHGLIKRFKSYQKVIKHLKFSGVMIDQEYEQGFERAILTFRHQRVYDPSKAEMVHLTDVPSELGFDLEFLGPYLSQKLATAIARGEVDPTTNKPFEEESGPGRPVSEKHSKFKTELPKKQLEITAQKNVLTNYFLKKQFRAPRSVSGNLASSPFASQEERASQLTLSQNSMSTFDKFSLTPVQSPLFETPIISCFMDEELHLDAEESRITDLTSDYCRPSKRACKMEGISQNDENLHPAAAEYQTASRNSELRTRKTFVPPLLQTVATQQTPGYKLRSQASSSIGPAKRSGYFSRPAPSRLDPTSPDVASKERQQKDTDVLADSEMSSQNGTNTQDSERDGFADHRTPETSNDVAGCPDAHNEQGFMKKTKKTGRFVDAIAAGKRKHIPAFKSNLLGDEGIKIGSFSSVSHVGHYVSLAQRSMDQFVSAIAPFRCSKSSTHASGVQAPSRPGTRASGLRAPSKSGRNAFTARISGTSRVTTQTLDLFAHNSASNTPRPDLLQSTPITAGTVRWQDYNPADWE